MSHVLFQILKISMPTFSASLGSDGAVMAKRARFLLSLLKAHDPALNIIMVWFM